ncbi:MAG: class I SAM-dependent methyltransferase [Candidatus Pacebacteria bacterium]|nr:class I SAM-dependent methyltransferase [Candidatus Paceibacterota bacterium]
MKSEKLDYCRVCEGKDLVRVLDLGMQPLANMFLKHKDVREDTFPLDVYLCEICGHVQLGTHVEREGIFSDYIYFSGPNPTLSEHFKKYAEDVKKRVPSWQNDLIIEIGSNDGILLKEFNVNDKNVLGIDPAKNIETVVPTWREFFNIDVAKRIVKEKGKKAKIIMANNVLAHTFDLKEMLEAFNELLNDDGLIIIEAPWLGDMFENNAYDTIYHEHLSYFSINTLIHLFSKYGFDIVDLEFHKIQGNSFRIFLKKKGKGEFSEYAKEIAEMEKTKGWTKREAFTKLRENIEKSKNTLVEKLKKLKNEGKTIAGYGAPAKGNTIINYAVCGEYLDYVIDGMPSKIGFYTPGSKLQVVKREEVNPDVFVMFAWNYKEHILKKEKNFKGEWIIPNQL